ncbi:unnamed protein product [Chrysoparadoxa australica]
MPDYVDITSAEAVSWLDDSEQAMTDVVQLLKDMIKNQCENDGSGTCREVASINVLKSYLAKKGIPCEIHHRPDKPQRPNLVATYGTGSPRVMLGPSHVDVVPVSAESLRNWSSPPFEGETSSAGKVVGRGAIDMLNIVATQVVTFARIATSQKKIKGTLMFAAVSDEEAGGRDGVEYLLEQAPSEVMKAFAADYTLSEVGGAALPDRHQKPTNKFFQAVGEKGCGRITVSCSGRAAHASIPLQGDNALVRAAEVVKRIAAYEPPTNITPEWASFVKALDLPFFVKRLLCFSWTLRWMIPLLQKIGQPALAGVAHAASQLTLTPNHLTGTLSSNVIPGEAKVHVDVRSLPGQSEAYCLAQVRSALGRLARDTEHIKITMDHFSPGSVSNGDTPMWRAMQRAAGEIIDGAELVPVILIGATDSRFYRRKGTTSYGAALFEPSVTFAQMMKYFHGDDEQVSLRSLWCTLQYYTLVIKYMMEEGGD